MEPINITRTVVEIGIEKPFGMFHITDTHIAQADGRDCERKQQLARRRTSEFELDRPGCTMEYYKRGIEYANANHLLTVHTGDLFDFVSEKHCEMAPGLLAMPEDYFMAVGNHEFSLYVGEAFEDATYKAQSYEKIQAAFPRYDLRFAARVVNGVNLIALDNVYYDFSQYQLECLKREAEKGLPMLLFMHTPLYTEKLYDFSVRGHKDATCGAIGVPVELMQNYSDHRFRQQITTPQTWRFLDYLSHLSLVKAVFAGHLHFSHESPLPNGVMQYITDAQYHNAARLIEVR